MLFSGQNMVAMSDKALRALRWRDLSVVMQSAMNALNPVTSIGAQFSDVMRAHGEKSPKVVRARSEEVLVHGGHRSRATWPATPTSSPEGCASGP